MQMEPIIKTINNKKYIDNVSIDEFINNNTTPAMIFNGTRLKELSKNLLEQLINNYKNTEVHYAIKACYTPSVIKNFFLKNDIFKNFFGLILIERVRTISIVNNIY